MNGKHVKLFSSFRSIGLLLLISFVVFAVFNKYTSIFDDFYSFLSACGLYYLFILLNKLVSFLIHKSTPVNKFCPKLSGFLYFSSFFLFLPVSVFNVFLDYILFNEFHKRRNFELKRIAFISSLHDWPSESDVSYYGLNLDSHNLPLYNLEMWKELEILRIMNDG